jgi:DNA-binding CsgD family transcriptional regulator
MFAARVLHPDKSFQRVLAATSSLSELPDALESAIRFSACFCKARATIAISSNDGGYIEVLKCSQPALTIKRRRIKLQRDIASLLPSLASGSERTRACSETSPFVVFGATVGGGFLSLPIMSPLYERLSIRGTLTVAREVPCRFPAAAEALVAVLSSLCGIAIATWEASERYAVAKSFPGGAQNMSQRTARLPGFEGPEHAFALSVRERQIASLLARDFTCKEIATRLGMSRRTVEHYVERLKLRSGASTLHGLIGLLIREGVLGSRPFAMSSRASPTMNPMLFLDRTTSDLRNSVFRG